MPKSSSSGRNSTNIVIIVIALLAVLLIMDFVGEGVPTGQQIYSDYGCVGGEFAIYTSDDVSLTNTLACVPIDGLETYKATNGLRECDYSEGPSLYYQQFVDYSYTGDQGYGYLCSDSDCGDGSCDPGDLPIEPHPEIDVVASADPGDWPIDSHPEIDVVT